MNRNEQIDHMEVCIQATKEQIIYWGKMTRDKDLSELMISQLQIEQKAFELYLKKLRKGEVK